MLVKLKIHTDAQFIHQTFASALRLFKCLASNNLAGAFVAYAKDELAAAAVR